MDMSFPDVMVDVETTGTDSAFNAMIQLAAVRFNLNERTVDTTSMFNMSLRIPNTRFWDEDTREWWGRQKREVLQEIYANMEDPAAVMHAFAQWVGYTPLVPHRFWAKPTTFDWAFVSSYFRMFNMSNPFHYRWATDVNSFIRGMAQNPGVEQFKVEAVGDAHNALHDCIYQIDSVFKAQDHYR